MKTVWSSVFRRIVFAILACFLASLSPIVAAAGDGTKLPDGGGEPGQAYIALIDAAYKKDYAQLCKLMADPAELSQCLQQKQALDGFIAMFTQPKSHKVIGGVVKGQEATLNVAYTFAAAPQSSGFVVMKQMNGKWIFSSFGGSGSGTVSAGATGQADLQSTGEQGK